MNTVLTYIIGLCRNLTLNVKIFTQRVDFSIFITFNVKTVTLNVKKNLF